MTLLVRLFAWKKVRQELERSAQNESKAVEETFGTFHSRIQSRTPRGIRWGTFSGEDRCEIG